MQPKKTNKLGVWVNLGIQKAEKEGRWTQAVQHYLLLSSQTDVDDTETDRSTMNQMEKLLHLLDYITDDLYKKAWLWTITFDVYFYI